MKKSFWIGLIIFNAVFAVLHFNKGNVTISLINVFSLLMAFVNVIISDE